MKNGKHPAADPQRRAFELILLFGLVSLTGDIIYEGARSVNGPFMESLAADAFTVALVVGLGEFIGYAMRLVSGVFADRSRAYWLFTFTGYGLLIAVPLMSLSGFWQLAAVFIVLERLGKAIRSPAKDAILSAAARRVGTGFGFGLHEAMDQIGAVAGPLIFAFLLSGAGEGVDSLDYRAAYAWLWIPFIVLMLAVWFAYSRVPKPEELEPPDEPAEVATSKKVFWIYLAFTMITAAGFISFALLGFHFKKQSILPDYQIPLLYAVAMFVDALSALGIGKSYDRWGLKVLLVIPLASLPIPLLALGTELAGVWAAAFLWGLVMGAHETVMKAAVSDLVPLKKRGTAYGLFHTGYGLAFFLGTVIYGFLYQVNLQVVILWGTFLQILAVGTFFWLKRAARPR